MTTVPDGNLVGKRTIWRCSSSGERALGVASSNGPAPTEASAERRNCWKMPMKAVQLQRNLSKKLLPGRSRPSALKNTGLARAQYWLGDISRGLGPDDPQCHLGPSRRFMAADS